MLENRVPMLSAHQDCTDVKCGVAYLPVLQSLMYCCWYMLCYNPSNAKTESLSVCLNHSGAVPLVQSHASLANKA